MLHKNLYFKRVVWQKDCVKRGTPGLLERRVLMFLFGV